MAERLDKFISLPPSPFPPLAKVQSWVQVDEKLLDKLQLWMADHPDQVKFFEDRWEITAPDGAVISLAKYDQELQITAWESEGMGYGGSTMSKTKVESTIRAIISSKPKPEAKRLVEEPRVEKPKRPKIEFTFRTSRGNEVRVTHDPDFMKHFEFRGDTISPTGYQSYFPLMDEEIDNPEEYAKKQAETLEEEFFKLPICAVCGKRKEKGQMKRVKGKGLVCYDCLREEEKGARALEEFVEKPPTEKPPTKKPTKTFVLEKDGEIRTIKDYEINLLQELMRQGFRIKREEKKRLCDICNVNEATLHYPGFVYEHICQSCHDQPTLWFPDKPATTPEEQRMLDEWTAKKPKPKVELGDFIQYGARIMVFGGATDGEFLVKDPFYPKGEYDLTVTKEKFEELTLPTKDYVISEYTRLERERPADFERRLEKLPEKAEEVEEAEVEEEEPEVEPEPEVPKERVAFPVKLLITPAAQGYDIELEHNGKLVQYSQEPTIPAVEEYLKLGEAEINLYEARMSVGDPEIILTSLHEWFGVYPELKPVYEKVAEDKWGEITDEEKTKVKEAWEDAWSKEWVLTWGPEDVKWSPDAQKEREIYYHDYSYTTLTAMKTDELRDIIRIKGLRVGKKDEMVQAIYQHGQRKVKPESIEYLVKEKLPTVICPICGQAMRREGKQWRCDADEIDAPMKVNYQEGEWNVVGIKWRDDKMIYELSKGTVHRPEEPVAEIGEVVAIG